MSKCPKFWDNQESVFKTFPSPYIFTEKFRPQKINGINLITKKKKKKEKIFAAFFPQQKIHLFAYPTAFLPLLLV